MVSSTQRGLPRAALSIGATLLLATPAARAADPEVDRLRKELSETQQELKSTQDKLGELKERVDSLQSAPPAATPPTTAAINTECHTKVRRLFGSRPAYTTLACSIPRSPNIRASSGRRRTSANRPSPSGPRARANTMDETSDNATMVTRAPSVVRMFQTKFMDVG